MNTLKIGDKVPNFSVTDQDGNTITMQDYQDKKVIVFLVPLLRLIIIDIGEISINGSGYSSC